MQVATSDFGDLGTYSFKLVATDTISSRQSADMLFSFRLVCRPGSLTLDSSPFANQIYLISSPSIVLPVPTFTTSPAECLYQASYSFTLSYGLNPLPAFISPEHPTTSVTIFTNDTSFSQLTFTIKFKAALDSDPAISDEFTFEVSLQCDVLQIGIT